MLTKKRLEGVKRKLDIKEVAENYGIDLTGGPERYSALCVFHQGDTVPSLIFYRDNLDEIDSFSAFCCNLAGDVLQFIIEYETRVNDNEVTFFDTLKIAEKFIGTIINEEEQTTDYLKERAKEAKEGYNRSVDGYKFLLDVFYRDMLKVYKDKDNYGKIRKFHDSQFIKFDKFFDSDPTIEETERFKKENITQLKQYLKDMERTTVTVT